MIKRYRLPGFFDVTLEWETSEEAHKRRREEQMLKWKEFHEKNGLSAQPLPPAKRVVSNIINKMNQENAQKALDKINDF